MLSKALENLGIQVDTPFKIYEYSNDLKILPNGDIMEYNKDAWERCFALDLQEILVSCNVVPNFKLGDTYYTYEVVDKDVVVVQKTYANDFETFKNVQLKWTFATQELALENILIDSVSDSWKEFAELEDNVEEGADE